MTNEQAPRPKVASSYLGALLVLVLGAWVHPALSATGADARCDKPIDAPPMSAAGDRELRIRVIDHDVNAGGEISMDDAGATPTPESTEGPAARDVDAMLQRIFDESQQQVSTPLRADSSGAPLTVDEVQTLDKPTTVLDSDGREVGAELPGFSADEVLRYRQQMFRKDI